MLAPLLFRVQPFWLLTLFTTDTYASPFIWFHGCTIPLRSPDDTGRAGGHQVTVIYSAECVSAQKASKPTAVLPLLVILFVISYVILTMLVFEQGQTIESQRGLIKEMMKDSATLAALKEKIAREEGKRVSDKAAVPTERRDKDPNAGVAVVGPKTADKDVKKPGKSAHVTRQIPSKPEADLEDVRRSTQVI